MYNSQRDPRATIRQLSGIGEKLAKRIIEDLGDGDPATALGVIERNPYELTKVDGIGFKKADKVAMTDYDVKADDVRRHEAGNRYILEQKGVLAEREYFAERVKLQLRDVKHKESGVEVEDDLYWLPEELDAEKGLENWIRGLNKGEPVLAELTEAQKAICKGLDEVQRDAVRAILGNRVCVLTGGAGCGKTHVIATAAQCLSVQGETVRGMAFAGKAADRMREQFERYHVQAEASTIHKALGFQKRGFTVDLLGENLQVIDEASMLPNWLLWAVVSRLGANSRLVLVGDPNQLPPIGWGTPFVDLIKSGVPRAHLSRNYRQVDQQGILRVAEGILERKKPAPADCVEFHLGIAQSNLEPQFRALVERVGGKDFNDWQAITYQNKNAQQFNLTAQEVINPDGAPLFEYPLWELGTDDRNRPNFRAEVRMGDKVIVVKNSTLLGIFNGQTGTVVGQTYQLKQVQRKVEIGSPEHVRALRNDGFDDEEIERLARNTKGRNFVWIDTTSNETMMHLLVRIGSNVEPVAIPEDELEKYIQLGYVITVHKAQGSDWDRVIVMQPSKVREDTARRFFYTAVTRAKTQLLIVSMQSSVTWWTNAAADAPDEPSSLMRRLAKPAPAAYSCAWCMDSGEECICNAAEDNHYDPRISADYAEAAALILGRPLRPDEIRQEAPTSWRARAAAVMSQPEKPSVAAAPIADADAVARVKAQFKNMEVA